MAGGTGTRFWPASRNDAPKQLLQLVGDATMLRQTVDRLGDLVPNERQMVVTNKRLVEAMREAIARVAGGGDRRRAVQARHGAVHRVGSTVGEPQRSGRDDGRDAGRPCDSAGREVSGGDSAGGRDGRGIAGTNRDVWHPADVSGRDLRIHPSRRIDCSEPERSTRLAGASPSRLSSSKKNPMRRRPRSTSTRANTIGTPEFSCGGASHDPGCAPRAAAGDARAPGKDRRRLGHAAIARRCSNASSPRSNRFRSTTP